MLSSSTFEKSGARGAPFRLALAFVAGFLAVPLFHQSVLLLLHLAGVVPIAPFDMRPRAPLGVPAVLSSSFWGGVWGLIFVIVVPRVSRGVSYWVTAFVFGAVALTLVAAFVVSPIKTGAPPPDLGHVLMIGGLLNGAWGIGTAVLLFFFDRIAAALT